MFNFFKQSLVHVHANLSFLVIMQMRIWKTANHLMNLSISLTGMSYSVGSVHRKGIKAPEDGETVALLKSAGGIPLLVSNTPEFCTSWESSNLVTGRSLNPFDTRRSPGGSSGGEASICFEYPVAYQACCRKKIFIICSIAGRSYWMRRITVWYWLRHSWINPSSITV